jgi:hypothetical protein
MRKFKDAMLQNLYDTAYSKGANDFMRRRGGSLQSAFMDGYKSQELPMYRGIVRGSSAWATMLAGKDRRKDENAGKIAPAEVVNVRLLNVR